jgi:hypothetical protein
VSYLYNSEERAEIEAAFKAGLKAERKAERPLTDSEWQELEMLAAAHPTKLDLLTEEDLEDVNRTYKGVTDILEAFSPALQCYIDALKAIDPESPTIAQLTEAVSPLSGQVREIVQVWQALRRLHAAEKASNRVHPAAISVFLYSFQRFYARFAHLGYSPNSPPARFIRAVAGPPLRKAGWSKWADSTASNVIRATPPFAVDLVTPPAALESPTLSEIPVNPDSNEG